MKRLSTLLLIAALLTACGSEEKNSSTEVKEVEKTTTNTVTETVTEPEEPVEVVSEYPFPADAQPIGEATITISTPGGDSSNGNVPVLFVEEDDSMIQVGINYDNFDGSVETFVYINEIFHTKEQVGERSQSVLSLSEGNLEPGEYTVTAVQYEGNDPTKQPTNFTETLFKIE